MSTEVNMNNQTKQKQPNYTIEFKQDAAKLVNEKDYMHKQADIIQAFLLALLGDR
jgi:hypothetical protein